MCIGCESEHILFKLLFWGLNIAMTIDFYFLVYPALIVELLSQCCT